jgi:hypothetical protein
MKFLQPSLAHTLLYRVLNCCAYLTLLVGQDLLQQQQKICSWLLQLQSDESVSAAVYLMSAQALLSDVSALRPAQPAGVPVPSVECL